MSHHRPGEMVCRTFMTQVKSIKHLSWNICFLGSGDTGINHLKTGCLCSSSASKHKYRHEMWMSINVIKVITEKETLEVIKQRQRQNQATLRAECSRGH